MDTSHYLDNYLDSIAAVFFCRHFFDCGCVFLENNITIQCSLHAMELHRYDNYGVFEDGEYENGPGVVVYKKTMFPVFSYPDEESSWCC